MDLTNLDFDQARAKHLLFKTNLRSILYGADVDHVPVLSQHECGVGKWIYSHALEKYGHIPEMRELEKVHANIHTCARELITQYESGEIETAREGLISMELIADNLIALLSVVEMKIRDEHTTTDTPTTEELTINYKELLDLHKTIRDLDERIKEQTSVSQLARKLAEANEHKFRNTVLQAPVGIAILRGEDMIVEMANDAYLQLVDKAPEEFIGRTLYASLPEVEGTVSPLLLGILRTGEPFYANEFKVVLNRYGKQEEGFFNLVYHPLRDDNGVIDGVMVVATEVTTQVKQKIALEQKDAQFRNLVSQSPIAMAIFRGSDFVIELANETLLENIWRKKWEEVRDKKLLDIFPELATQQFPKLMQTVLDSGVAYKENEAPAIVNSHDGSRTYYLDFEYAPLYELDGSVSGIMVTVSDVTEKVEARRTIEAAEKRYRDLIDTLPVAVFTINKDGFVDLYNQAAINLWARTPIQGEDKWCGSHGLFTLDGVLVPHEDCPMATALKENRAIHTEAYVQQPDGTLKHVIAHPQPMHDSEGNVTGAMNVLIDITDRKESETALRSSEEKFRVLANSMPQFIWTAGPDGVLNYFSQSVFDYSGFTEERIFREGWLEIVHPDDREKNVELWIEAITKGKPFHYEHRFRKHDGEFRWQLSRAVPQMDAHGNIQMWVGTSTDIHDRKLFSDELEEKVEERTKALRHTNEDLVRSNGELIQFAYVASHDLQEPLRKIQAFVSRILETEYDHLSNKGRDYLERIQRSSNRTQKLIQDLLAFSRANAIEKNFEPTDLNILFDKVKEDLSELVSKKQVTIIRDKLPVIHSIGFQIEQLFANLVVNAIKFSKEENSKVEIKAAVVEGLSITHPSANKKTHYHHISVSDNGIGFEQQYSDRIFLVFQRLHARESYEGTGIGLAICKRIVENHNGFITATGQPHEGATFDIYLPVN